MKITIEKKERVEIEVQLPAYRKSNNHFYMIAENKTICVFNPSDNIYSIEVNDYMMKFPFDYDECSKELFEEMYNQVKSKL